MFVSFFLADKTRWTRTGPVSEIELCQDKTIAGEEETLKKNIDHDVDSVRHCFGHHRAR